MAEEVDRAGIISQSQEWVQFGPECESSKDDILDGRFSPGCR